MGIEDVISLTTPGDALASLRGWVRAERQRLRWTQGELARRSGVPSATISRLELTGLGSTEVVMKILFALNRLDAFANYLKDCQWRAELPTSLRETPKAKPILRVRARKEKP